jgi:hypothetical protein
LFLSFICRIIIGITVLGKNGKVEEEKGEMRKKKADRGNKKV